MSPRRCASRPRGARGRRPPAASPSREARSIGFPFLAGALGALVGAALALGSAWLIDPRAAVLDAATSRLTALERGDQGQLRTNADFDKRLGALEASEAGVAKAASRRSADAWRARKLGGQRRGVQTALAEARAARADAAKALALAAGTGQTAPRAEPGGAPASFDASASEARLGAVGERIGGAEVPRGRFRRDRRSRRQIGGALAAPKSEARIEAAEVAPNRDGATEAILAISLNERLNAGAPFGQEWAALTRLGADGAKLAALKPFADAGPRRSPRSPHPSPRSSPKVVAAAAPPGGGGVIDRYSTT